MITYEEFARRADHIRGEIAEAARRAGRQPESVRLLAVTKTHPAAAADYVARYGLEAVGENRVQEAAVKRPLVASAPLRWELIGHLQSNKAKLAVRHFDRVQSVDSEKLLTHLDRAAEEAGKVLPVLLQINAGNDPAKFGAEPGAASPLLAAALAKKNLRVEGLMTIAPLGSNAAENADAAHRTFANLRSIRDELRTRFGAELPELSMGMSGDLAIAIAEGSTLVRIGTALFGAREVATI
jgi:pyridoxal phosphate enzyme (YggS family)